MFTSRKFTLIGLIVVGFLTINSTGQSSDVNFPAPVTESEVSSTIKARDIGDSRLTTHYWAFDGTQGDIFINVVTQNFSGDINVYQASDLKPLTQMVMYADNGVSETGRVIYMRQPGRLLLRVQGRTPNDDPATYKIKFAGAFVALEPQKQEAPPTVASTEDTGIKVNSVGTIIAVKPKAPPAATTSPERQSDDRSVTVATPDRSSETEAKTDLPPETEPKSEQKSEETAAKPDDPNIRTIFGNKSARVTVTKTPPSATANPPVKRAPAVARRAASPPVDPMAGYRLVIVFKDGSRIEREMSEVVRFIYDRGFLSVVRKDGSTDKYPATVVASVTVQQP